MQFSILSFVFFTFLTLAGGQAIAGCSRSTDSAIERAQASISTICEIRVNRGGSWSSDRIDLSCDGHLAATRCDYSVETSRFVTQLLAKLVNPGGFTLSGNDGDRSYLLMKNGN